MKTTIKKTVEKEITIEVPNIGDLVEIIEYNIKTILPIMGVSIEKGEVKYLLHGINGMYWSDSKLRTLVK